MNELLEFMSNDSRAEEDSVIRKCIGKLDGHQILMGIGILCGTLILVVSVACFTGYDISINTQCIDIKKH